MSSETASGRSQPTPIVETDLNPENLSPQKNIVRRFYKDMWDKHDTSIIPDLIHPGFTFRGSLGPVLVGHAEFASYVRWLTTTLDSYTSDILDLVEEGNKVVGKLRFHGIQRGSLFGQAPSEEWVWWIAAAIFTFEGGKIKDLWVLGDVYGLLGRLKKSDSKIEFVHDGGI